MRGLLVLTVIPWLVMLVVMYNFYVAPAERAASQCNCRETDKARLGDGEFRHAQDCEEGKSGKGDSKIDTDASETPMDVPPPKLPPPPPPPPPPEYALGPKNIGDRFKQWSPKILIPGDHTVATIPQKFCATRPTQPDVVYQLPEKPPHASMKWSMRPPRDVETDKTDPVVIYIHGGDNLHPHYIVLELVDPSNNMQHRFEVKCSTQCTYTRDHNEIATADAIVHLGMNDDGNPFLGKAKRLNIKWHDEAPYKIRSIFSNRDLMKNFDLYWFWHRNADILGPSHDDKFYDDVSHLTDKPNLSSLFCSPGDKTASALAVCVIGACASGNNRNGYISELRSAGLSVDYLGGCDGTPRVDGTPTQFNLHNGQYNPKIQKISEYKFYLAFENDNMDDWITEKVYQGLIAHSIPIYLGAPNIDEFVPPHSIIKTSDFATPKALVDYVNYVANNQTAYEEYFAWKKSETWTIRSYLPLNTKRYQLCGACLAVQAERNRLKAEGLWETTALASERRTHYKIMGDNGLEDIPYP